MFIGVLAPVQALLNRHASALLPSRLQATWWSFAIGDIAAILIFVIEMSANPAEAKAFEGRMDDAPVYIYFGGFIGAIFIASTIIVTGIIGSAPYFVCLVCGQIVGSVLVEEIGALGAVTRSPGIMRIFGEWLLLTK